MAPAEQLEVHLEGLAVEIERVLARDHARREEGVRLPRQGAVHVGLPVVELEGVRARAARLEPEHPGRPRPQLARVDPEVIQHRGPRPEVRGLEGERTEQEPLALVDLRAVHVFVAPQAEPAVAELELEGGGGRGGVDRLRGGARIHAQVLRSSGSGHEKEGQSEPEGQGQRFHRRVSFST